MFTTENITFFSNKGLGNEDKIVEVLEVIFFLIIA